MFTVPLSKEGSGEVRLTNIAGNLNGKRVQWCADIEEVTFNQRFSQQRPFFMMNTFLLIWQTNVLSSFEGWGEREGRLTNIAGNMNGQWVQWCVDMKGVAFNREFSLNRSFFCDSKRKFKFKPTSTCEKFRAAPLTCIRWFFAFVNIDARVK